MDTYLNKVNLGNSPDWLQKHLPDECIHLTFTSPPVYDNDLYIVNEIAEFGWQSYEEYLSHLTEVFHELFRVTIPGGHVVIDTSSGPKESGHSVLYLFPLVADITKIATSTGFNFTNEVIWVKDQYLYEGIRRKAIPNVFVRQKHDQLLVFSKPGEQDSCGEKVEVGSVWHFPSTANSSKYAKYHEFYATFPTELVRQVINLWSCPHALVLDPYAGSGQVIKVAIQENRTAIGIESDVRWQNL